jgi:hypothetical protein
MTGRIRESPFPFGRVSSLYMLNQLHQGDEDQDFSLQSKIMHAINEQGRGVTIEGYRGKPFLII